MSENIVTKPNPIPTTGFFNKFIRFIASALLADVLIGFVLNLYISKLNVEGVLDLGEDFNPLQLVWGKSIWLNIVHLVLIGTISGLFGFLFGYLSKKVNVFEKITYSLVYAFARFVLLGLVTLFIRLFIPEYEAMWNEMGGTALQSLLSSPFDLTFVVLSYLTMFMSSFIFIGKGVEKINDPYHLLDKERNGTLLDVKWYHYLWLSLPIAFYSFMILDWTFQFLSTLVSFFSHFEFKAFIKNIFGVSSKGVEVSLTDVFFSLLAVGFGSFIVLSMLNFIRKVLSGKTRHSNVQKISISLGIGFGVPTLIGLLVHWFS